MGLSELHLERLCNAVYLEDILPCKKGDTLGDIVEKLLIKGDVPKKGLMTKNDWEIVMKDIVKDRTLSTLIISDFLDFPLDSLQYPGYRVICFSDGIDAFVVFRGTRGDKEWEDNGRGMLDADTYYQKAASDYVKSIRKNTNIPSNKLVVAGHSKGGNKAQYAFITTDADRCFSLDGQGFSVEFCNNYKKEIKKKASKIESYAERRDFVNCLGVYLKEPLFFTGRRGNEELPEFPYGHPLPYFHCPDGVRNENDALGEPEKKAYIPQTINCFVNFVLSDDAYADSREKIVMAIVSLMTRDEQVPEETLIEVAALLIDMILELFEHSPVFRKNLTNLFMKESQVINASIHAIKENRSQNHEYTIIRLIEHKVSECILEKENGVQFFENFLAHDIMRLFITGYKETQDLSQVKLFFDHIANLIKEKISNNQNENKPSS